MTTLSELEPKGVFHYFEEICRIPHGSGNVADIADYLAGFAQSHDIQYHRDPSDNIIMYIPATAGYEDKPSLIIQGHMDMVAVSTPESGIDMATHSIELQVKDDFLSACDTSMGGDDGIAVAMCLALLEAGDVPHPALEIVFTSDEETGMFGAAALDMSLLKSKYLINIDSEEEGIIYAGCAGGARVGINLEYETGQMLDAALYSIDITGCTGGHSGSEIHHGRANANILSGRILYELQNIADIRFVSADGGVVDNAIPTASKLVIISADDMKLKQAFDDIADKIKKEYASTDPGMEIRLTRTDTNSAGPAPATKEATARIAALMKSLPDGVQKMSADVDGLVETSLNLGVVKTGKSETSSAALLLLHFAVRSSVASAKAALIDKLDSIAQLTGADMEVSGDYPGWQYRPKSHLRDHLAGVFEDMYDKTPVIKAIHAGLECGFFSEGIKDLDCASIGPDMYDVHTVKEHLSISSVKRTWEYLLEVLRTWN